jgi:D-glycero-D-manno-heptose 1,7-bisphosphate phosphatase
MKRAAFLDRDGVINRAILVNGVPRPPSSVSEVEIIEGVKEALQLMSGGGYLPVVVTNQPDVARGTTSIAEVELINSYIGTVTGIKHFYTCFHDDTDQCLCRKPEPGLLWQAGDELSINLCESIMIGDRWRDIEAGQAAGCNSFFIDYSYPEKQPKMPFTRVSSLEEVAQIVMGGSNGARQRFIKS